MNPKPLPIPADRTPPVRSAFITGTYRAEPVRFSVALIRSALRGLGGPDRQLLVRFRAHGFLRYGTVIGTPTPLSTWQYVTIRTTGGDILHVQNSQVEWMDVISGDQWAAMSRDHDAEENAA